MDAFFVYLLLLNSPDGTPCQIGQCGRVGSRLLFIRAFIWAIKWTLFFVYIPCGFVISAHGESYFPNGLEFPRLAKVVSWMVWDFRVWRKSFPEWFVISALGESRFPNGLAFPCSAKVVSRIGLCLRASRKSVLKGFDTTRYKAKINQQKNFW